MYKIIGATGSCWPHQGSRMLWLALCLLTGLLLVSSQDTSTTTSTTTVATPQASSTNTTTTTSSQTTITQATPEPASLPANNGTGEQQVASKAAVLRPSLEEEASALSRRYLNLVHENRRPRLPVSAAQSVLQSLRPRNPDTEPAPAIDTSAQELASQASLLNHGLPPGAKQTVDAEQEITQPSKEASSSPTTSGASSSPPPPPLPGQENFFGGPAHELWQASQSASSQPPSSQVILEGGQAAPATTPKKLATSRRKKSGGWSNEAPQASELEHCHQYLQRHSWPTSGSPAAPLAYESQSYTSVDNSLPARLLTNSHQLLPCACSKRPELHHKDSTSSWLSCDHVQLMGSHFYSSSFDLADPASDRKSPLMILRFSQRDAGLQTLHSQKFHYLQLFHLKSIDLSHNRIRLIKLDAFHGIETELEHLDLSHNLLGDSRGAATVLAADQQLTGDTASNTRKKPPENNQRLIFASDELIRLGRLRWLSLHNNQIALLSPSVFIKQQQQESSNQQLVGMQQLTHLDLSENLLKSVPSDSIQALASLRVLKLNRNRIGQLDGDTRFPSSLTHLDLSENSIRTIRRCQIIQLTELTEINLSHNQLSQLDKTAFISSSWASIAPGADLLLSTASGGSSQLHRPAKHLVVKQQLVSSASSSRAALTISRRRRRKRDLMALLSEPAPLAVSRGESHNKQVAADLAGAQPPPEMGEQASEEHGEEADDELQVDESILSSITNLVTGSSSGSGPQSTGSGKSAARQEESLAHLQQTLNQFNSTLKLNLSHNLFQGLPGDSLVKFAGLQQLDLSYNRIRRLDSNYLCSLYNLVENLRELDLSGNLLSVAQSAVVNSTASSGWDEASGQSTRQQQLNMVFGCLQRLEKLSLSSNRLQNQLKPTVTVTAEPADDLWPAGKDELAEDSLLTDATDESGGGVSWLTAEGQSLEMAREANSNKQAPAAVVGGDEGRLVIKFGEGYASKHLNHLDLSDNQLTRAPLFQYIAQPQPQTQPAAPPFQLNDSQWHMSHWLGSRVSIQVLDLSYNYIERLEERDLEHLRNIRQLKLDYNRLLELPGKLMRKFTSLDSISVEGNKLSKLEPLNELFEKSSRTLRVLNLSYNRLSQWPTHTGAGTRSSTPVASSLLESGEQQQPPQLAFVLEQLSLEGNLLTSDNVTGLFEQLSHMRNLRTLKLSQNLLHRVKSEWFKFSNGNLRELVLTANRINTIDLGSFTRDQVNELTKLSLDYNLLRELKRKTFDSMPRIRELNLANNFIHTINSETFYQINSLQVLKLNNNKLSSWRCEYFSHLCNTVSGTINADLSSLITADTSMAEGGSPITTQVSSLIELDLSHNSLSQLRVNSISVHTKLAKLNLSHNKLSFIPHDLFRASASGGTNGRQVQLVSSLKYLNLANNRIQTVDNINFKPLRNLMTLDLSFNELQTLGTDVVIVEPGQGVKEERKININQPLSSSSSLSNDDNKHREETNGFSHRGSSRSLTTSTTNWPALVKLRHLNVAHNQLTAINQSLISELSPFALLNLNLSSNLLDSEALPHAFYTKISGAHSAKIYDIAPNNLTQNHKQQQTNPANYYDLVFTLKLESLDLSHNRLHEFPVQLLDNHYTSMETCNLAHNRIQDFLADSNLMIQIKSLNLEFNPLNRQSNELILFEQKNVRKLNLAATRLFAIHQATKELEVPSGTRKHNSTASSQLDLIRSINKPINAPYLRELNLSSNQLVWLAANVFDQLHSLRVLDLSNNQLTRLHLLNNQLMRAAPSLEHLNLASNLFTSIDQSDLSQLKGLKQLDLSNLPSLQRMNCKFLSKLSSLRVLRLLNYPQLRRNTESLINNLKSISPENLFANDKLRRKMRNELLLSTLGRHCFVEEDYSMTTTTSAGGSPRNLAERWYDLTELQLELFNDFSGQRSLVDFTGEFVLDNQIQPLLGPNTRKLILVGINLTDLTLDSLSGILSHELELKISYTSIYKVPLDQIFSGLSKKTKLDLDFRNNNIQLIEAKGLQLLDEFQLQNRLLEREDHSVLSLASNPIRCDCQARPLWLWLNQRWSLVDQLQVQSAPNQPKTGLQDQEAVSGETGAGQQPTYWMKFKGLSRTSDLKCYQPTALRGKLTQHVFYNDLICHDDLQPIVVNRQSRRRVNDSSLLGVDGVEDVSSTTDEELASVPDSYEAQHSGPLSRVVSTKFNRYNQQLPLQLAPAQQVLADSRMPTDEESSGRQAGGYSSSQQQQQQQQTKDDSWESRSKKGKRDHASSSATRSKLLSSLASQQVASSDLAQQQQQQVYSVSQYWRHPMGALSGASGDINVAGKGQQSSVRRALLTDIDVLILTGISIAMALLSLIIISVCLLKQRLDRGDEKQQMLDSTRASSFVKSLSATSGGNANNNSSSSEPEGGRQRRRQPHKGSSGGCSSSEDCNKSTSNKSSSSRRASAAKNTTASHQTTTTSSMAAHQPPFGKQPIKRQLLVPIVNGSTAATSTSQPAAASANFLMRSPTIKRMHGLANNATDWFKFTLSKPAANLKQRGQLFRGANYSITQQQQRTPAASTTLKFDPSHRLLSVPEFVGCPVHEFACVQRLGTGLAAASTGAPQKPLDEQCAHCQRLLAAMDGRHFMLSPAASSSFSEAAATTSGGLAERPLVARPQVAPKPSQLKKFAEERGKQTRPMRTFGALSSSSSSLAAAAGGQQQTSATRVTELPSDAIEGRFAYQPESQLVSPGSSVAAEPRRAHKPPAGRITVQWPPSSGSKGAHSATDDEQLFILVEEEGRHLKLMKKAPGSLEMSEEDDQCSNSSSPVAYGFMRSSSSIATTISSTPLRGHKYVPEYATSTKKAAAHLYSTLGFTTKSTTALPDDNNNNNNNELVSSSTNKLDNLNTAELLEQVAPATRAADQDDQTIIISRL